MPQKLLSFTDLNDATVIGTTITRGSDAINIDNTHATIVDQVSSVLGAVVPFVAGTALKKGTVYLGEKLFGSYGTLRGTVKDAHHVIQDAAVRDLPNYNSLDAPSIHLEGPSTKAGTPHNLATVAQRERRALGDGGTYKSEMNIAYRALRAAGLSPEHAKEAVRMSNSYSNSINVTPTTTTRFPYTRK
ncbi:hypothetical protein QF042_001898 [Pedobacter sp. W3I1]|uniref:hypothetical protein n=1 Tax=Pedobacter sp. W3I1 TaxID=3042291 RepID=UPI002789435E|nr:hypothetical protein [Pedobacter sp. W3I1]MDQ0638333.1 hypothetical protein [Pedobacter sp. W3I1]